MHRSPGERPKPQLTEAEFHDAIGPLVRNCSGAEFTADRAKDYYILLQFVPAKFLRAAVVEYLRTATEAWFPMPRVLLDLARRRSVRTRSEELQSRRRVKRADVRGLLRHDRAAQRCGRRSPAVVFAGCSSGRMRSMTNPRWIHGAINPGLCIPLLWRCFLCTK